MIDDSKTINVHLGGAQINLHVFERQCKTHKLQNGVLSVAYPYCIVPKDARTTCV